MEFKTLTQDDQDLIIVQTLKAQEQDLFCHQINKSRYEAMLPSLPEGEFKERIGRLLLETNSRLEEVSAILEAVKVQAPSQERIDAVLTTIKSKELQAL